MELLKKAETRSIERLSGKVDAGSRLEELQTKREPGPDYRIQALGIVGSKWGLPRIVL
jgi:hypothetical protein